MTEPGFPKPDLFTRRCGTTESADWSYILVKDGRGRPPLQLHIRDHSCRFFVITVTHQGGLAQPFLALLRLGGQDVTQPRLVTQDLSRRRFLEALGSAFVCF